MPASAAAAAESLTAVATAGRAALLATVEHWHEYYLLTGTAAVTLVGLLFVALSFHLDTLLHESKAHLLGTARMAFTSFIYVMMLSLGFLAPGISPHFLGLFLFMLSGFLIGHVVWVSVTHARKRDREGFDRFLRRRYVMTGVIAAVAMASAVRFLSDGNADWFRTVAFIVAVMLVNAASISWDLLVQVGRLKQAQERRSRE